MKKLIALMGGGVIVVALVFLNERFRGSPFKLSWNVVPEVPLEVETQQPVRRAIIHTITAPGTVEPVVEVDISSQVVGRIERLPVREGDRVKVGDVLARLDSAEYRARVRSAEARVQRLEAAIRQCAADLEKAGREVRRFRELEATGAASTEQLDDAETSLSRSEAACEMARQELIEAKASLESAQEDLKRTVITSPIDGLVAQVLVEEGEVLIPGTMNNPGTVFMVISDMAQMQVRTQIDESDVALVRPGQRAWIYLTSDDRTAIPGRVERVTPKGVRRTEVATFETRILIERASETIRSGMTANVEIEVREHADALTVPSQAVRHRKRKDLPERLLTDSAGNGPGDASAPPGPGAPDSILEQPRRPRRLEADADAQYLKVVFVVEEGKARMRVVEIDISDESHVEITSGLREADRVVTGPYRVLDVLTEGRAVKIAGAGGATVDKDGP